MLMAADYRRLFTVTREIAWGGSVREVNDFLEKLCMFSRITEVWFVLWQGGGVYRFTDIFNHMGISRGCLSRALRELCAENLVRMVGSRYQAVCPEWMLVGDPYPSGALQAAQGP